MRPTPAFTSDQLTVINFCTQECQRQKTDPQAVLHMVNAWNYARMALEPQVITVTPYHLRHLAMLVEPRTNHNGYRTTPVHFEGLSKAVEPSNIERAVLSLCREITSLRQAGEPADATRLTKEFLEIHPWNDGNGRVAALLYNVLIKSIHNPFPLPEFDFAFRP